MYNFRNNMACNMPTNPQQSIAGFSVGIIVVEEVLLILPGADDIEKKISIIKESEEESER